MRITCPDCYEEIKPNNINITTDLAKCESCNSIQKVSELVQTMGRADLNPPNGSKILMHKGLDGNVELTLPKRGFYSGLIPLIIFGVFWIGFIAFWTIGAARGSIIFALFSLPFWCFGIMLIIAIINSVKEVQVITINRQKITIERRRPIRSKSFETTLENIHMISMRPMKMNLANMFGNLNVAMKMKPVAKLGSHDKFSLEMPGIVTGSKTEFFLESAGDVEQEWAINVLNALVKKMR